MKHQKPRRTPGQTLALLKEEAEFYRQREVEANCALGIFGDSSDDYVRFYQSRRDEATAAQSYCGESVDTVQKAADLMPGLITLEAGWRDDRFTPSLRMQGALA